MLFWERIWPILPRLLVASPQAMRFQLEQRPAMSVIHASQSSVDLLAAVVAIQRKFTVELQPHAAFEAALSLFLETSGSDLGFVGEVLRSERRETPFLEDLCDQRFLGRQILPGVLRQIRTRRDGVLQPQQPHRRGLGRAAS